MPTIHHRARLLMVGTLSLCPPYGLAHALHVIASAARNDDVEAMSAANWHDGQITSDFQKSCQARD
jgi:hypothetical protein